MRTWFNNGPLYDREPMGGGGDTTLVDPGAPHEVGHEEPEETPVVTETAEQKELKELRAETDRLRRRAEESEEDARYWAGKSKQPAAEPVVERRAAPEPAAILDEKPEVLLDDLNREGLQALKKRGFIDQATFQEAIDNLSEDIDNRISAARSDAEFGGRIAAEFPEIAADSKRVSEGERPQTELFKRAGAIYRAAVAEDPALKGSKGLLLIAARQAKAELSKEGKGGKAAAADDDADEQPRGRREPVEPRQSARRDRIDRQRPDRTVDNEESRGGKEHYTDQQLAVMKNLGVKPDAFNKHRDAGGGARRNGRN